MTVVDIRAPEYRYVLTDLLTNAVIGELPFSDVTYGRQLKTAGEFSGTVPVIPGKTNGYDLYQTTLPGRTGLYVLRNNECVWGGIIWSRDYDLVTKSLTVYGQEFISYLHHRHVWKTFITDYGATAEVDATYITLTLAEGSYARVRPGSKVRLLFVETANAAYNNVYTVVDQPSDTVIRLEAAVGAKNVTHRKRAGNVVTLWTSAPHGLVRGQEIKVTLDQPPSGSHNGTKTVGTVPHPNALTYKIRGGQAGSTRKVRATGSVSQTDVVQVGTYSNVTARVHADTYDYARTLVQATFADFTGIEFAYGNEPGIGYAIDVTNKRLSQGVATLVTEESHDLGVGQFVTIRNVDDAFNGRYEVLDVTNDTTFTYTRRGYPSVSSTAVATKAPTVTKRRRSKLVATLTTSTAHTFNVGDLVLVEGVDAAGKSVYNGSWTVTGVPTATTFTYRLISSKDAKESETTKNAPGGAKATVRPEIVVGSYGSFPQNSDIGIEFADTELSGVEIDPVPYRGGEVTNVGEALETYSESTGGFDYRIDCAYDPDLNQFTRTFQLLDMSLPEEPGDGVAAAISAFGADRLVFEHPGNVSGLGISESAEDAATRFFVTGDAPDADSNPYYAGASAVDLLAPQNGDRAWPLLEAVEAVADESSQVVLYNYAERYLRESKPPVIDITVTVNGSISPVVGTFAPGDWCSLVVDDDFVRMRLINSLELRDRVLVRKIQSFSVTVPNGVSFPETVTLQLVPEWEVDRIA